MDKKNVENLFKMAWNYKYFVVYYKCKKEDGKTLIYNIKRKKSTLNIVNKRAVS